MAISLQIRQAVRERALQRCEYCHADETWQFVRFTIDHILPTSLGGTDAVDNLALACRNCNERRGNRVSARDPETGAIVATFHPRQEDWQDHFVWDHTRIRLVGRSPIGRATIVLLDMNDDYHEGAILRVRQRDVADGYHPPPDDPILSE